MNNKPRVKICCIASAEEARLAIDYGASALGFVSEMPSGPGVVSETVIAEIVKTVPPAVATFLLTSKTTAAEIILQQRRCHTNTVQLVDHVSSTVHEELRETLYGIAIVQVIHVSDETVIEEAVEAAKYVDAILLDSGNPRLTVKELGGTGRVHDWRISKKIRESIDVPLFLAGGLKPENTMQAIAEVRPFGLDVCSGVRTNGKLDEKKLRMFFNEVNQA
ncbi:MAG: phosphoribosylanthranilate isomerase [Rhizobacter sp.]|nr:phosphoribosylanthranilate isomerase [Chlorobiales bacterium]